MGRLFWKLFFAFWLAVLVAGVAVGTAVWLHSRSLERSDTRLLLGGPRTAFFLDTATATLKHGGPETMREVLSDRALREDPNRPRRVRLLVVDDAGHDLLGRAIPPETLEYARAQAALGNQDETRQITLEDGHHYLLFAALEPGSDIRSAPPRPPRTRSLLLSLVAGLFASLAFSALLAWYLSQPARHLRRAFAAAARGDLALRVTPLMRGRRDEIADLGQSFDHMAQRLQALLDAQRRLLHDVSHELRSPLARMQAAIGLARQDPQRLLDTLDRLEREANRLDTLIGELLALSRLETGGFDRVPGWIDPVDLAATLAEDARFESRNNGRDLVFHGEGEALLAAQPELLHRAFENVLRNAVKYTAPGTTVTVEALAVPGKTFLLRVTDRGPGVPETDLQAIFEPFYRCADAQPATGFGLGLAIARRAVLSHDGSITARNREGGGLIIDITLPLPEVGIELHK
jgi:two-component system OmpR family sensor kinase